MALWESLVPGLVTTAAGVGMAQDMTELGADASADMLALGGQVAGDMAFKPYSVKTGLGTTTIGDAGQVDLGVGQNDRLSDLRPYNQGHQAMKDVQASLSGDNFGRDASQTMIDRSLQDPMSRQMSLFEQMQAAQQPALQRARAAMESRLHAQGRMGIQGNQFGGTSEQLATAKAEAEARNSAMLQAGQLAREEQAMQGDLGYKYGTLASQNAQIAGGLANQQANLGLDAYRASFLPIDAQLNALQQGTQQSNLAQTGQISGQNMLAQLGLGGIQAEVNAGKAATELYGNMFGALSRPLTSLGKTIDDGGGMLKFLADTFGFGE